MISVLIPIFNYNTFPLVKEIHHQLSKSNRTFEIICIDDASTDQSVKKNQQINDFSFCSYTKLNNNIGRSKIRNLLAKQAQFTKLLFLDCDVLPAKLDYIDSYLQNENKNHKVICGGILYENRRPDRDRLLRWVYGKKREEVSSEKRSTLPHRYFFPSNFLIDKTVFDQVQFQDKLTHYGYEDLLFSEGLKNRNIAIKHFHNPVFHLGIDTTEVFLNKIEYAVKNLAKLYKEQKIKAKNARLLKTYQKLKNWYLLPSFLVFFNISQSFLKNNLKSKKPSLFLFDLYRLGLFSKAIKS